MKLVIATTGNHKIYLVSKAVIIMITLHVVMLSKRQNIHGYKYKIEFSN